jgi:tripartite-type tricarboxylate transporter receptor subunit TctC
MFIAMPGMTARTSFPIAGETNGGSRDAMRTRLTVICATLLGLAAIVSLPLTAQAQEWPAKPIRIIESLPPGVARDTVTRVIAEKLSAALPQRVFVENRPGGGGRIAGLAAAQAAPDGYTFLMVGIGEAAIIRHLYNLPYDIDRDFVAVSQILSVPVALVVRPLLPAKTVADLVAYARQHPDELTYGSTGAGLFLHLNGLLFAKSMGIALRHIPYVQGNPFSDLLGGHIDMVFDALIPTIENVKAGRLRALAITGEHRLSALPDLPTFAELGFASYNPYGIVGLLAPKATPNSIVVRMPKAISDVLQEPELRRLWESQGNVLIGSTSIEFAARVRSESDRWREIIGANNIRVE